MREVGAGRLITICLFLLLALPLAFFWMQSDILPGHRSAILMKLFLVDAAVALVFLFLLVQRVRSWQSAAQRLEQFANALPHGDVAVSIDEVADFGALARSLKAMALRVGSVMDRSKVELARRETILACMAEGVLAVDHSLRVIFCNEAFAQAFGTRMPVNEGRILYEVVREPIIRDILERVIKSGLPERDRLQLPSAAGRWFEARALPISEHPQYSAVIVLHDVTDIERQEQVRKDFVADVSHEFRTPLAAIRGYAETLLDGALEDSEHNRKFVEIIQAHAIRLNNIASDLLVISELDRNAAPSAPPQPIRVWEVIESAVHTVEGSAALSGVVLDTTDCQECSVIGFRFRLEQALTNLLDNAVKFNRPNGRVTVTCAPTGQQTVEITVADTGMGIPQDDLRRIFERFYRVDKARTRPVGGTGLGLPIVKEVVERMGGSVSVESQLGRGSKFTVFLKASEDAALPAVPQTSEVHG